MSLTHATSIRTLIANLVVDKLDLGSANASGAIVFKNSIGTTLATLVLSNPAFGAAASGIATAETITSALAVAVGTISKFELQNRDREKVIEGSATVAAGGGDVEFSGTSLVVAIGDTVAVTSLIYNSTP